MFIRLLSLLKWIAVVYIYRERILHGCEKICRDFMLEWQEQYLTSEHIADFGSS